MQEMEEMCLRSPGGEALLEKSKATQSTTLAWIILWTEKPGALQSIG